MWRNPMRGFYEWNTVPLGDIRKSYAELFNMLYKADKSNHSREAILNILLQVTNFPTPSDFQYSIL
jgi:hypothetical protein